MPISRSVIATLAAVVFLCRTATAIAAALPLSRLNDIFGGKEHELSGGVIRYRFVRADLNVTMSGQKLAPALALSLWAAFAPTADGGAYMMGEMDLHEFDADRFVHALQRRNIVVTAVGSYLIGDAPRVLEVHFMGKGDAPTLAKALKHAAEEARAPLEANTAAKQARPVPQWVGEVERALGRKGSFNGEALTVAVKRADQIKIGGDVIPPAMGLDAELKFQTIDKNLVLSVGYLPLTAGEVDSVGNVLQHAHIGVTALHNHMLNDEPRLFFMHYATMGTIDAVGAGLKAALADMNVKPPGDSNPKAGAQH